MVNTLGVMDDDLGDYQAAERQFREAADILRRQRGPPPLLFYPLMGIQRAHLFRGEFSQARSAAQEALDVAIKTGGEASRNAASGLVALAVVKAHQGDRDAAALSLDALRKARQAFPEGHIKISRVLAGRGRVLLLTRQWKDAESVLRESYELARRRHPDDDWRPAEAAILLGVALAGQNRNEEAQRWLMQGREEMARVLPGSHPRILKALKFRTGAGN
jgi:serine/threonine-protein kinase